MRVSTLGYPLKEKFVFPLTDFYDSILLNPSSKVDLRDVTPDSRVPL